MAIYARPNSEGRFYKEYLWKKLSGIQWLVQGIWGAQVSLSGGCDDLGLGHISHPESFTLEHQTTGDYVSASLYTEKCATTFHWFQVTTNH